MKLGRLLPHFFPSFTSVGVGCDTARPSTQPPLVFAGCCRHMDQLVKGAVKEHSMRQRGAMRPIRALCVRLAPLPQLSATNLER